MFFLLVFYIFLRRCVNGAQGSNEPASQKVCESLRKQGGESIAFKSFEQAILKMTWDAWTLFSQWQRDSWDAWSVEKLAPIASKRRCQRVPSHQNAHSLTDRSQSTFEILRFICKTRIPPMCRTLKESPTLQGTWSSNSDRSSNSNSTKVFVSTFNM